MVDEFDENGNEEKKKDGKERKKGKPGRQREEGGQQLGREKGNENKENEMMMKRIEGKEREDNNNEEVNEVN